MYIVYLFCLHNLNKYEAIEKALVLTVLKTEGKKYSFAIAE